MPERCTPVEHRSIALAVKPATAAEMLDCSRQYIYKMMAAGQLATVKIGASRRIPRSELDRLANEGTS